MKQLYSVADETTGIAFNTGTLAKQANGSVTAQLGETCVFVSVTAAPKPDPAKDYFPLSVDYREKFSAAGRFPGGYIKREGRPTEKEVLVSRLCDRPLRPLFPVGFRNEVQILGMLLSADTINESDIVFVNASSAALLCSDIPWNGPVACVRIADVDGSLVVNPTNEVILKSTLDLVYVGTEKEMLMIEGSADQIPEERFIEALTLAQNAIAGLIEAQKKLAALAGKQKKAFDLVLMKEEFRPLFNSALGNRLDNALFINEKQKREGALSMLKSELETELKEKLGEAFDPLQLSLAFEEAQEQRFCQAIFEGKRPDGRAMDEIRPIECSAGVLPRVHGSSVFQRGETQALVISTLGTSRDAQELDGLTGGASEKSFVLHYNFPPFSVGEVGRTGAAGRREIGHGALAERSLVPVLPTEESFPYAIRVVSDILESNGSSSMATVCGGTLALMDAGVPISAPVAGISVGLANEADWSKYVLLMDIQGVEDHFGNMDFKICGTSKGITGFQLDLKAPGLPIEVAKEAIFKSREARLKILEIMAETLSEPRQELSPHAPQVEFLQIDPSKIGALIGPGGKNIKKIIETTGCEINIDEDNSGKVSVYSKSVESLKAAKEAIQLIVTEIEEGKVYRGIVLEIKDFGVIVECMPGKEGLVHVSELAEFRVEDASVLFRKGDEILVKCIERDEKGRVRLSRKAALCEAQGIPYVKKERPARGGDRDNRFQGRNLGRGRSFGRGDSYRGDRSDHYRGEGRFSGQRREFKRDFDSKRDSSRGERRRDFTQGN